MTTPRLLAALALLASLQAFAAEPAVRDPQIDKIVAEISPANIEANIRRLVGFKTRHTLSSTTDPEQGIGAARNWIKSEFDRYSRESGGRLEVAFDPFLQSPAPPRVMHEVEIVNVVATLRGKQPASAERVYVVSGHYDSRSLNPLLGEPYAPGANDDASGTAAVLELARVMSKYEFDATIVFMTVAAEEQGLFGAKHWADTAKKNKVNVAAMLDNDIIGSSHADDGRQDNSHVRLFAEGVPPAQPLSDEIVSQIKTGGENDFATRQLARAIRETALAYVPQMQVQVIYRRDRFLRGGDHSPFL
ncbi:MAG: aminopeptidase, partial [Lacunisphaera sp.]|nr:aminopeptidase [Lacunisphaera sp.]